MSHGNFSQGNGYVPPFCSLTWLMYCLRFWPSLSMTLMCRVLAILSHLKSAFISPFLRWQSLSKFDCTDLFPDSAWWSSPDHFPSSSDDLMWWGMESSIWEAFVLIGRLLLVLLVNGKDFSCLSSILFGCRLKANINERNDWFVRRLLQNYKFCSPKITLSF